jgi:TIR domain
MNKNKPTVFISHSFSDEGWTREFANSLQQRGLKVWLDSNAIHLGHSLTEATEKGLPGAPGSRPFFGR